MEHELEVELKIATARLAIAQCQAKVDEMTDGLAKEDEQHGLDLRESQCQVHEEELYLVKEKNDVEQTLTLT